MSKTNIFFSRFEGTRGENNQIIRTIVQIVCYVSSADYSSVVTKTWNEQFNDEDRAYEHLLTIVVMPRLPRNAKVEWHAIAAVDRKLSR